MANITSNNRPIDQIGMMVIGCSIALDGKWMPLFIMLACWLLDVMLAMMVIECPIDIGGFWILC
jgi:ABC-type protease/lipase transport system fused ATPase/permease subunit